MGRGWERGLGVAAFVAAFFAVGYALFVGWIAGPWAGVLLVVGSSVGLVAVVAMVVWWRARRRRTGREALPPHRPMPAPVPTLGEDETIEVDVLAEVDGPFTACPECAFLGVRFPGIRDGLWPGGGETGGRFVCPRCGFQGIPIEFESGDAYAAFVRSLNERA